MRRWDLRTRARIETQFSEGIVVLFVYLLCCSEHEMCDCLSRFLPPRQNYTDGASPPAFEIAPPPFLSAHDHRTVDPQAIQRNAVLIFDLHWRDLVVL